MAFENKAEQSIDMTEIVAAAAKLKGHKPPSGPVIVPASMFPVSDQIKKEEAATGVVDEPPVVAAGAVPTVGDKDEHGWKYAGLSPSTGKPLYIAPEDAGVMKWDDAVKAAQKLQKQGKPGTRLPSWDEVTGMFNDKTGIGKFNETGAAHAGWYWSSRPSPHFTGSNCIRSFDNGDTGIGDKKKGKASVRLVRSVTI